MTFPADVADAGWSPAVARPSLRWQPPVVAFAVLTLATVYLGQTISLKQAELFLVGVLAGIVLYHAAFGFTSSWRTLLVEGRGNGVRAQMLMLAVTSAVFFPVLASGHFFGTAVRGSVSPIGVGVVAGAFLFGVGMQLGGSCASGTLYTVGGGSTRMIATLAAFVAGSVIGAMQVPKWEALPSLKPISLVTSFGPVAGLALSLVVFAAIAGVTIPVELKAYGRIVKDAAPIRSGWARVARGPWPLAAGALGLAAVNILTLALAGRPWSVTGAFPLWGGKILAATGANLKAWTYFAPAARQAELHATVFKDVTSVQNFGIMLGALAAATLAGKFSPTLRISGRSLAAAIVGGLMLGYGARIAYGCNIGAFFSGIASGSVHAWIWFPSALAGNFLGTRLRPLFGLSVR
jgi:uncharacterized membrane protein YedE/YeeE